MGVNDNTLADTFSNYLTTSVLTLSSVSTADSNMQLTCRENANTLDSTAATLSIYSEFEHVKSVCQEYHQGYLTLLQQHGLSD